MINWISESNFLAIEIKYSHLRINKWPSIFKAFYSAQKMTSYWPTIGQFKCILACHW